MSIPWQLNASGSTQVVLADVGIFGGLPASSLENAASLPVLPDGDNGSTKAGDPGKIGA